MRLATLVLGAVLTGGAVAPYYPQPTAVASCVGPSLIDVEHLTLERGTSVTVEGSPFVDGCNDTGSCSVGCGGRCDDPEPVEPQEDIHLELVQGGRAWPLGNVDADDDGRASWTFVVPEDADLGRARLVADGVRPVQVRIS